ncbi:MAG TPA: hypothetical protein VHC97_10060 [Thermoanaerobaculia bacterium]|jgi:hypothetical protein|nr:hypothetical protein [Thermoanaerobaculia bacterium]
MSQYVTGSPFSANIVNQLKEAFRSYLQLDDGRNLDDKLGDFLSTLRSLLFDRGIPPEVAAEIFADLSIILPLHIVRKRKEGDLRVGGVNALVSAFEGGNLEWLRKEIIAAYDGFKYSYSRPVRWTAQLPLNFIGFDPRYKINTDAKEAWNSLLRGACGSLATTATPPVEYKEPNLLPSYNQAKAEIYADFHNAMTRYDLLLVDFSWLPELVYLGHVVPLDPYSSKPILEFFKEKIASDYSNTDTAWWSNVLSHLASGGNEFHYALPAFINLHGRLVKSKGKHKDWQSFEQIDDFQRGAIQNAHSACCVYELYAHFAYHGASPLVIESSKNASMFKLVELDFGSQAAREALADYLARLWLASGSNKDRKKQVDDFVIDHIAESGYLVAPGTGEKFDICFNSELYHESLKDRGYVLGCPYVKEHQTGKSSFLSSLGGYGIAVSRQSVDIQRAVEVAISLFQQPQLNVLPKNFDFHDTFKDCATITLEEFLSYHCRPRVPFWSHVEELISFAVDEIFRIWSQAPSVNGNVFKDVRGKILEFVSRESGGAQSVLKGLNARIKLTFQNNGWDVSQV